MLRAILKTPTGGDDSQEDGKIMLEGAQQYLDQSSPAATRSTVHMSRGGISPQQQQQQDLNNHNHTNNHTTTTDNSSTIQYHNNNPEGDDYTLDAASRSMTNRGGGSGAESTAGSSMMGTDGASYIQDAKWRRRTRRLLERSAEQQHEQARRAGHVANEHFWNLALQTSPSSPGREMWYPSLLSDIASVESILIDDNDDDHSTQDEQSQRSLLSRSRRVFKRYSFSSSHRSESEVESLLGGGAFAGDSSVRAMKRGVRRGKREDNESKSPTLLLRPRSFSNGSLPQHHHHQEGDITTHTSASTAHRHHYKKKRWQNRRRWLGGGRKHPPPSPHRRRQQHMASQSPFWGDIQSYIGPALDDDEADAWMCGVCGKAFATLEAADKHEQDHIRQVVDSLPWMLKAKGSNTTSNTTLTTAAASGDEPEVKVVLSNDGDGSPPRFSRRNTDVIANHKEANEAGENEQEVVERRRLSFTQEKAPPKLSEKSPTFSVNFESEEQQRQPVKPSYVRTLPSDLLDEILEGEPPQQGGSSEQEDILILEESSQMRSSVIEVVDEKQQRLSDALIDEVLEEEKEEIEYMDEPGKTRLFDDAENNGDKVEYPSMRPSSNLDQADLVDGDGHHRPSTALESPAGGVENWPDNEYLLPQNTLVPQLRSEARLQQFEGSGGEQNHSSVPYRIDRHTAEHSMQYTDDGEPQEALLLTNAVRDYVILADEALMNVCEKARRLILSPEEIQAERQLALLARDKFYYDDLARRSRFRKSPINRNRFEGQGLAAKVQNKFLDAYQLMKEGTDKKGFRDEYNARGKKNSSVQDQKLVVHNQKTMYLNVMVKNGIQVVKNELERLAQERWESAEEVDKFTRFERFRLYAHVNLVRLAGLALSSDFTPRRIAVQLSNDIYRLLTPRLKRRGVAIETEIEYRVGPYFVLAVNVLRIDWRQLLKATHRAVRLRQERWERRLEEEKQQREEEEAAGGGDQTGAKDPSAFAQCREYFMHVVQLTRHDIIAHIMSWLYHNTHWLFYQPLCILCYHTFFGSLIRHFILSSVSDEIFYYVEERGLEMEIGIRHASLQAAFMLSALREIRADSKDHKEKQKQGQEGGKENILGPLLGPAIAADKDVVEPPAGFEVPEHLEFLGLELEVPVGFRRLRWAFLSGESSFITEALYRVEAKYDNITMGSWNRHPEHIGSTKKLPEGVSEQDFIGAEKEASYLMPKSAFVKANMCSETHYIVAYNDYCFTYKKKALTPDVPYGSTFVAWTQFTIINLGHDSCRLQFSVEPEFPNGPPMVSRQITSGMRAGVGQLFVLIHETIAKYADEYP